MKKTPEVVTLDDGSRYWEQTFEKFLAKVYVPECSLDTATINYGFRAPYLLVFEETKQTCAEAAAFARKSGLSKIAAESGGSVVFLYPANEGGWSKAPSDLFAQILSESRISRYYRDGIAFMRDIFTGAWGDCFIRGAAPRTCLYGTGAAADYIAGNCLKSIEGDGLYGKGDITPAVCILENLSVIPAPERRDIPVISIKNSDAANRALSESLDYIRIRDSADYETDFREFAGAFRRLGGRLEKNAEPDQQGMVFEPGHCTVPTSPDNHGDDSGTKEHTVGYVAYYNKGLTDTEQRLPLVLCFHGAGDSAMCMAALSGWFMVAAKYNFLLVSVENHYDSTATETAAMVKQLQELYPVDPGKIYATGFSMGGCKSWDIFQECPEVFAAIAPMSAAFDTGLNMYGQKVEPINQNTILPVFYVGGEKSHLPELPFQGEPCARRLSYVRKVNQAAVESDTDCPATDYQNNPVWGTRSTAICRLEDATRGSLLTLHLFESTNGCCYCCFGSVSGQGHEVRHHSCENAWKFLSCFCRLPDGSITGGKTADILKLYTA